jgi:cytoskeletal protein CcmA (bactofilin family)
LHKNPPNGAKVNVNVEKKINSFTPNNDDNQIAIIGKNFEIKGDLSGAGAVIISGKIEGNISATQVIVERGATVLGDVACTQIDISGHVRGQIDAATVVIREKASIEGDLSYSTIAIENGSTVSGKLKQVSIKPSTSDALVRPGPQPSNAQRIVRIAFPIDLSRKLQIHEARMSAHLSLEDGSPPPAWISLNQDKLGLSVDSQELKQLQEKNQKVDMRLHVGSQYFDFSLPVAR